MDVDCAVLADVHANVEALTAVLEDVDRRGIRNVLFLGDAVGYGGDPATCLDLIRAHATACIAGNHDRKAASLSDTETIIKADRTALCWTAAHLGPENRAYLLNMDLAWTTGDCLAVHGSPFNPEAWHYLLSARDAERGFAATDARIIFVGHSHLPALFQEVACQPFFGGIKRTVKSRGPADVRLSNRFRHIINPGSVGQPRDGDCRAAYGIFSPAGRRFTWHRVPYDVQGAAAKIIAAGLPAELAARLVNGV